ncbi:MAG: hypothetical protein GC159_02220 [Phycisphaera sp.]|nr:hypothetical protein [Phycisphaera sp.]
MSNRKKTRDAEQANNSANSSVAWWYLILCPITFFLTYAVTAESADSAAIGLILAVAATALAGLTIAAISARSKERRRLALGFLLVIGMLLLLMGGCFAWISNQEFR